MLDHLVAEDDGEPVVFIRKRAVEICDLDVDSPLGRKSRPFLDGLDAVNLVSAGMLCDADGQRPVVAAEIDEGTIAGGRHEPLDVRDVLVVRSLDSRSGPAL